MRVAFPLVVFAVASVCYGMADSAVVRPPPTNLKWHYYKITNTCRDAEEYVRHQVKLFWDSDRSITAKLLRLVYTDCFVTVCTLNFVYPDTACNFSFLLTSQLSNTKESLLL